MKPSVASDMRAIIEKNWPFAAAGALLLSPLIIPSGDWAFRTSFALIRDMEEGACRCNVQCVLHRMHCVPAKEAAP